MVVVVVAAVVALAVLLALALDRSLVRDAAAAHQQAGLALVSTGQSQFDTKTCKTLDLEEEGVCCVCGFVKEMRGLDERCELVRFV
jgi:hypothetical protein